MATTCFICPNGKQIPIRDCLKGCPYGTSCIARPTLFGLAKNCADRKLNKFSVTELLKGAREVYLNKTKDCAIDPLSRTYATFGSAVHKVQELAALKDQGIITELRLENDIATGQIDAFGPVFSPNENVICDYKVTTAFKAEKALGFWSRKEEIETDEIYKVGPKKGQHKTKLQTFYYEDGVHDVYEWALQQNFYRMLLEEQGYKVDGMYIQMIIRDFGNQVVTRGRITKPIIVIKLNKISDYWLNLYFRTKKERIEEALMTGTEPPPCSPKETWDGKKCASYCDVAPYCSLGLKYLNEVV